MALTDEQELDLRMMVGSLDAKVDTLIAREKTNSERLNIVERRQWYAFGAFSAVGALIATKFPVVSKFIGIGPLF